ncbi:11567_t:CDS:2 [Ambispora gerdemannii]|uniref:11567_t:CDS:1 n=1 Tax=Ambispora gerdemannii TaxID=144530 RepID=A0A9N9C6D0_9GLOM|nr:11567_t:CDS:2 [Ambispora gerdemannii]
MATAVKQFCNDFGQFSPDTDVVIQAGQEPDIKAFQAHSAVLRARSAFFQSALSTTWARKEGNRIVLKKPNVSPLVFEMLLYYLYNGRINLDEQDGIDILNLLVAADELLIAQDLLGHIQDHLITVKTTWLETNFGLVLHAIFRHSSCFRLQDYCLLQMCWRPELVFAADDFLEYDEDILSMVLEQEDLQMEEKDVWENLLRWGFSQIRPRQSFNIGSIGKLKKDEIQNLYEILKNCIPLIRFTDFSNRDFSDHVWPFRDIVPDMIRFEIEKIHKNNHDTFFFVSHSSLLLPRCPLIRIDSTILHPAQAAYLPEWIEFAQKNSPASTLTTEIPDPTRVTYQFKLLVRGTIHGFTPRTFHERCDNQGPSIVVLRVRDTRQIIGGYNPIGWRGLRRNHWQYTCDSFLFSFGSKCGSIGDVASDVRLSRVLPGCEAIYDDPKFGPCFGKTDLDMRIKFDEGENCSARKQCYKHNIFGDVNGSGKFSVDEYEVFQIYKA